MLNNLLSLLLSFMVTSPQPQNLNFDVHAAYSTSVKTHTLANAQSVADIIPQYPSEWIKNYAFVEVIVKKNGAITKAAGKNSVLSTEQKTILRSADIGSEIAISIGYTEKNAVTENTQSATLHYEATVIPEKEAEYQGGYQQLSAYIQEHAINKISDKNSKDFKPVVVKFTVNERGEIANAHVAQSSNDAKIDKTLLQVITKMPKWRPAETAKGVKVKQEFQFNVGPGAGGGSGC
ncbi:MAG: energy transducer TonB [Candidatus Kapaibacterium sp.]